MTIYTGVKDLPQALPATVVSIGNFDGLHRGHQALVRRALDEARRRGCPAVVYTFEPHPIAVLAPEIGYKPLFTREYLAEQLAGMGVDVAIFEPFTREFGTLSAAEFVERHLVRALGAKAVIVGENFNFGRGRGGTVETLAALGPRFGFEAEAVAPVKFNGETISSSRIRKAIQSGDMELAEALLGRTYSIDGTVVTGAGRGRGLGIPTANIVIGGIAAPKRGVYATLVEDRKGGRWPAVSNLGVAPTFSADGELRLETHILDQKMELVGTALRVHFLSYIREERRFTDVSGLVAQIQADIHQARAVWSKRGEMGGPGS